MAYQMEDKAIFGFIEFVKVNRSRNAERPFAIGNAFSFGTGHSLEDLRESGCDPTCFRPGLQGPLHRLGSEEWQAAVQFAEEIAGSRFVHWLGKRGQSN